MVDLELDDGLAVITIDRPHARNAISLETMDQLEKALDGAEGAAALGHHAAPATAPSSPGATSKSSARCAPNTKPSAMAWRMRSICDRIAGFPAPTIAALNGHALGGGAEFAVAADIRLAADDIKIGFNQVALAIMPAWGGAERLVALVGYSKALLLAGTGTVLDAAEAERIGLVDRVLPRASFDAAVARHRAVAGDPSGRGDQAGDARRPNDRGRRCVCAAVGGRRALGRRRQGDEARQVIGLRHFCTRVVAAAFHGLA